MGNANKDEKKVFSCMSLNCPITCLPVKWTDCCARHWVMLGPVCRGQRRHGASRLGQAGCGTPGLTVGPSRFIRPQIRSRQRLRPCFAGPDTACELSFSRCHLGGGPFAGTFTPVRHPFRPSMALTTSFPFWHGNWAE